MSDAPPIARPQETAQPVSSPAQHDLPRRPSISPDQARPPPTRAAETIAPPPAPYRGPSIGGLNDRGEAVGVMPRGAGLPTIQVTSSLPKKRQHDENNGQPNAKKVCDDHARDCGAHSTTVNNPQPHSTKTADSNAPRNDLDTATTRFGSGVHTRTEGAKSAAAADRPVSNGSTWLDPALTAAAAVRRAWSQRIWGGTQTGGDGRSKGQCSRRNSRVTFHLTNDAGTGADDGAKEESAGRSVHTEKAGGRA